MPAYNATPRWRERIKTIPSRVKGLYLPKVDSQTLPQDREWCEVRIDGDLRRVRFHDYAAIYRIPGLYEELFYKTLKCCSPSRVVSLFAETLRDHPTTFRELRILDVGAGNGMVGDELRARGAAHITGVDIVPEAEVAAKRDRPGVYDDYFVVDLTDLSQSVGDKLRSRKFNCLTVVAALGFADIPPEAFMTALDLIATGGWVVFNVKEDFLKNGEQSGFSRLINRLTASEALRIEAYRRYRHRLSVSGKPLHYVAVVARKLDSSRETAH